MDQSVPNERVEKSPNTSTKESGNEETKEENYVAIDENKLNQNENEENKESKESKESKEEQKSQGEKSQVTEEEITGKTILLNRFTSLRKKVQDSGALARIKVSATNVAQSAATAAVLAASEVRERREKYVQQQLQEKLEQEEEENATTTTAEDEASTSSFQGRYQARSNAEEEKSVVDPVLFQMNQALTISHTPELHSSLMNIAESNYVMVLPAGMMGVNLKQCYHPHYGVYIDFLVPEGSAAKSQVVHVGDTLLQVNGVSVEGGNINQVPGIISKARRPAALILKKDFEEKVEVIYMCFGLALKLLENNAEEISIEDSQTISNLISLSIQRNDVLSQENSFLFEAFKTNQRYNKLLQRAFIETCKDERKISFLTNYYIQLDKLDKDSCCESFFHLYIEIQKALTILPLAPKESGLLSDLIQKIDLEKLSSMKLNFKELTNLQQLSEIQTSLIKYLGTERFLSFIASDHFGRMRAYLRGTYSFYSLSFHKMLEEVESNKISLIYLLLQSICKEKNLESLKKEEETEEGVIIDKGPKGLCCALFIKRMSGFSQENLARLWDIFICPHLGLLHQHDSAQLKQVRMLMMAIANCDPKELNDLQAALEALATELIYEYALTFATFKEDGFYETYLSEIPSEFFHKHLVTEQEKLPILKTGCLSRLLRNTNLPTGISTHRPHYKASIATNNITQDNDGILSKNHNIHDSLFNADYAIVFGTADSQNDKLNLRRFGTIPLGALETNIDSNLTKIKESDIPSTLELYASLSTVNNKLQNIVSKDGWELSLINFIIPNSSTVIAASSYQCIYGVSLVLRKVITNESNIKSFSDVIKANQTNEEESNLEDYYNSHLLSNESMSTEIVKHLQNHRWSDDVANKQIGITFISSRCVIPAMRESLKSFCQESTCNFTLLKPLVDTLGSMSVFNLVPFFTKMLSSHVQRGILSLANKNQETEYLRDAGEQLLDSLPPVALSVLVLMLLLEQKIVLASERRSLLLSVSQSLTKLIAPLEYSHLNVPYVPSSLAHDLVHYPGSFLIGIVPSEEITLADSLPTDVTYVDLDASHVSLAKNLSDDEEKDLKYELYALSDILGQRAGKLLYPKTWNCDGITLQPKEMCNFEKLQSVYSRFINELLDGVSSCCYYIEEENEVSVLFDEDRFYHVKNVKKQFHEHEVFLETFLRCQGLSSFISSLEKGDMIFC